MTENTYAKGDYVSINGNELAWEIKQVNPDGTYLIESGNAGQKRVVTASMIRPWGSGRFRG